MTFVFFACRRRQARSEPAFIKTGFSNWKKSEVFAKHEKSDCHKHSLQAHRHWKSQKPIHHQIDEENERQESYRQQNVRIAICQIYITLTGHLCTTLQTM